jgi:hypothetical protein
MGETRISYKILIKKLQWKMRDLRFFTAVKYNSWFSGVLCLVVPWLDTNISEDPAAPSSGLKCSIEGTIWGIQE